MKKLIALLLAVVMVLGLAACGGDKAPETTAPSETTPVETTPVADTYTWKERGDNVWYFQATFAVENQKALAAAATSEKYGQVAHLVTDFKPYWKYDVAQALVQNAAAGTREGDIYATLDSLRQPAINGAITAASEEEAMTKMNEFYAACEAAGLADYNKFINDQYQAIKAGFAK